MCTSGDIIRDEDVGMEELCAIAVSQKVCPPYLHCEGMKLEINDSTSVVSLPLKLSALLLLLSKLIVKLYITFSTVISFSQDQFSLFVTHRQKTSCMLVLLFFK